MVLFYLLESYFPRKCLFDPIVVFERAYYANFDAIDKTMVKFKQQNANNKQGRSLKRIYKGVNYLADMVDETVERR